MKEKLTGKVAIVTGSSSGIGASIAKAYADAGAKVVVVAGSNLPAAEEVVAEIKASGGEAVATQANMANLDDIKNLVSLAVDTYGTVDVLVNNAGILDDFTMAENVTDELWDKVLDVNTKAVMRTMREVLPIFKEKSSGVILNIGSISSFAGSRGGLAYTASKHAIMGMTKNVAYQYADAGIRCNAITPGGVETNINSSLRNPDMEGAGHARAGVSLMPRIGKSDEIASVALFLASDDSSFVNGASMVVDGGWSAY